MFCDVKTPDGEPFEGDPRRVLERMVQKAADAGYVFNVGPELEFFYFKDSHGTEVLDRGSYFDLTSLDYASDLRRDTVLTLEKMGIPVEYSHHEMGPSQHEIDLRYADALSMADAVMTYKLVVKEIALKHGVYASFMPKPMSDAPGSGMHVHQSLFDLDGNNAFFDENDPWGYNLSDVAKRYIAGLFEVRARILRHNQPVRQFIQAIDQRKRCPHLSCVGEAQPLDARARARIPTSAERRLPRRAAQPRPCGQPLPRLRGHAGRRIARYSRRTRASAS